MAPAIWNILPSEIRMALTLLAFHKALKTGCVPELKPVIPIFTKNLREGYRTLGKIWPFKWLYECTRWPIVPIYGGFPVKFCTYIGDPIPYDPNISAGQLAEKTKSAIKDLRNKYQEIPGSIKRALLERFEKHPEK
uniref:Phospholipid/glycerol acyltransferase domain-containing protein n=1 Tax=Micrurus spixii TaxID=129469 RepID=A0A2D4MG43_9SAUR